VSNGNDLQYACKKGSDGSATSDTLANGTVMMVTHWYEETTANAASVGCWDVTLARGVAGQGAMIMLRSGIIEPTLHTTTAQHSGGRPASLTSSSSYSASDLFISAVNPHSVGGELVFIVSGQYSGGECRANSNGTTTVTLLIPSSEGRVNGQGVSGKTVSTRCSPEA